VIDGIKAEYAAQGAKIDQSDGIRIDAKEWYEILCSMRE
jgi:hypothetical protein